MTTKEIGPAIGSGHLAGRPARLRRAREPARREAPTVLGPPHLVIQARHRGVDARS